MSELKPKANPKPIEKKDKEEKKKEEEIPEVKEQVNVEEEDPFNADEDVQEEFVPVNINEQFQQNEPEPQVYVPDMEYGERKNANIDDYNDDLFYGAQEGEMITRTPENIVYIPQDFPVASLPLGKMQPTMEQIQEFIYVNKLAMLSYDEKLSPENANVMALLRLLAVKEGLMSPEFDPKNYYCKYNECVYMTQSMADRIQGKRQISGYRAQDSVLSLALLQRVRKSFCDRVGIVAVAFRIRGHHFLDTMQQWLENLWQKCKYQPEDMQITFESMNTIVFHAILPCVLDQYYLQCCSQGKMAGALMKRRDAAPAGFAGPSVIYSGLLDIQTVAPGIKNVLGDAVDYLREIMIKKDQHRFNGSVNAQYYGADRLLVDEKKLASIAAVIRSAIVHLADDSPMINSIALQRIANQAPITGAIIAKSIQKLPNREDAIEALLEKDQ